MGFPGRTKLTYCANRMTGRSIDAWSNKRTQEQQNIDTVTNQPCRAGCVLASNFRRRRSSAYVCARIRGTRMCMNIYIYTYRERER